MMEAANMLSPDTMAAAAALTAAAVTAKAFREPATR
jgi:hypothetical protein